MGLKYYKFNADMNKKKEKEIKQTWRIIWIYSLKILKNAWKLQTDTVFTGNKIIFIKVITYNLYDRYFKLKYKNKGIQSEILIVSLLIFKCFK